MDVAVGSARARATGSDHAAGRRVSQEQPGIAVTGVCTSSAKTRLARRTRPWSSTMQMAWWIASTVFSHSRLAFESSSTRRAFSSAIAACASTAVTIASSASPKAPARSLSRQTAPIAGPAGASGVSRARRCGARGLGRAEGGSGMIVANVRGRRRAQDLRVVATALAGGDVRRREDYERLLLEEGPDRLLDNPGLLEALLAIRTLIVPSPLLFAYVAVRHTLLAAGVIDRDLADYLAALLLEFGDHDRSTRIPRHDERTHLH